MIGDVGIHRNANHNPRGGPGPIDLDKRRDSRLAQHFPDGFRDVRDVRLHELVHFCELVESNPILCDRPLPELVVLDVLIDRALIVQQLSVFGDKNRDLYATVGESDRMTLRFVKPGKP